MAKPKYYLVIYGKDDTGRVHAANLTGLVDRAEASKIAKNMGDYKCKVISQSDWNDLPEKEGKDRLPVAKVWPSGKALVPFTGEVAYNTLKSASDNKEIQVMAKRQVEAEVVEEKTARKAKKAAKAEVVETKGKGTKRAAKAEVVEEKTARKAKKAAKAEVEAKPAKKAKKVEVAEEKPSKKANGKAKAEAPAAEASSEFPPNTLLVKGKPVTLTCINGKTLFVVSSEDDGEVKARLAGKGRPKVLPVELVDKKKKTSWIEIAKD